VSASTGTMQTDSATTLLHVCAFAYLFTGKERDNESELDYFGARYYGSTMGRWLTPDWSGVPVPVPYADLANPQSLNGYEYVGNNPATGLDPDGLYRAGPNFNPLPLAAAANDLEASAEDEYATDVNRSEDQQQQNQQAQQ